MKEAINIGYQLDTLARAPLWQDGLDFRHGTGHGVGAYLNVHEGPHGIGARDAYRHIALQEGMVVTNGKAFFILCLKIKRKPRETDIYDV